MDEWQALRDRHEERLRKEDYFHARTAAALSGKAPSDLMVFKPKVLMGPDGKPLSVDFDDLMRRMGGPDK